MNYTLDLITIILLIVICTFCLLGCTNGNTFKSDETHKVSTGSDFIIINEHIEVISDNVFYFDYIGKEFVYALGDFSCNYNIVAIAPDDTYAQGYTKGYIVVANKKEKVE